MSNRKKLLLWSFLFVFILGFSLLFFFLFGNNKAGRVLFFTDEITGDITGEVRQISLRNSQEDNIEFLLKELILGPVKLSNTRVIPGKTRLKSVLLRNGTLYIDFSRDIIFIENDVSLNFTKILDVIQRTIRFNFPEINEITILVDGEVPISVKGREKQ